MTKQKYIFKNFLSNRYNVSTTDKVETIDDTKCSFSDKKEKLSVLFIIDLGSRPILKFLVTKKDFNASHIARAVKYLLLERDIKSFSDLLNRLIIHTDRDTHFCSKAWRSIEIENQDRVVLSMSAQGSPVENAVSERFHRTIKNLRLSNKEFNFNECSLSEAVAKINSNEMSSKQIKNLVKLYVDYYNDK